MFGHVIFRYVSGQIDRQTNRQTHRQTNIQTCLLQYFAPLLTAK